jgi:Mat/Ecp fimbriae outer membrane usher protein
MEANTDLGAADITGRYNEVNDQVELSGRISSSFATTGKTSAIGGKRRSESAFLVRVEGDIDADASFNVLVNSSIRGQLNAGETLLIPVSPYYTYNVELKAVGETLIDLESRVYRETMYPGNVVNLSWSSQVINIALGRLVDEQGEPLGNAVIQNVVGIAMTDDNGIFQAEIDHQTNVLEVVKGNQLCVASFTNPGVNDTVLPLGTLVCR